MLTRMKFEPRTKPFLEASFILTDQQEAALAEILFGFHPEMLQRLVAEAVVREIQGDPEKLKRLVAMGSENGKFVLGSPKKTDAGLEFPFKFYVVIPKTATTEAGNDGPGIV